MPISPGKTTTLSMLTTLLTPTAGTGTVVGADLLRDPVGVRRRIGYVAQAIRRRIGSELPGGRGTSDPAARGVARAPSCSRGQVSADGAGDVAVVFCRPLALYFE